MIWPFRGKGKQHGHPAGDSQAIGRRGEKAARTMLARKGLKILGTNYTCPRGEADIVALDRAAGSVVFVEVKTRSSDEVVSPLSAVNAAKRRRLRTIAEYYIGTHDIGELNVRFDVVSVLLAGGDAPRIEHIPDAF